MIFHNYICSRVQKASKRVVDWFLPWTNLTFGFIYSFFEVVPNCLHVIVNVFRTLIVLSILNIWFVWFAPYLRLFNINILWIKRAKQEIKCEQEEAKHKAKETLEEESCKTEINDTKAREEVRRLKSASRLVWCSVRWKIFHSKSILCCVHTHTQILQFKILV